MIRAWRSNADSWPLRPTEQPQPTLASDELLVAVEGAVVGAPERFPTANVTPGGAGVGEVIDAGSDAAELRGKRVVFGPDLACGECDVCRRALTAACPRKQTLGQSSDGALASAVVVRARWVCALEDRLAVPGPEAALLGREAAWAYGMFVRAGVGPGDPVIITGDDVTARFLVEIAIARGTRPLMVSESLSAGWRAWIEERGGIALESAASRAARDVRHAAAEAGHGERPAHVFVTRSDAATRALALASLTRGGQLVLLSGAALGERGPDQPHSLDAIANGDGSLLGIAGTHPDLLPELAALVVHEELNLSEAAAVIGPDDMADAVSASGAFASLHDPPRALVVDFR